MKKIFLALVILLSFTTSYSQTAPPADNRNQAEISFDKESFDFGTIPQNVPATHIYAFTNTGKEPLIITSASASCGCTVPDWTKEPVSPGKKGFIKATYNAAGLGGFTKTVTVLSNAKRGQVVLTIKGDVKAAQTPASTTEAAAPKKN